METNEPNELEETILSERRSLELKSKDVDLVRAIDFAISESKSLKEIADKIGKRNELYWEKGTDIEPDSIHPKKAKITDNRIFMSVETILPMVTSRTPEPSIIGGNISNYIREKLIKVLTVAYEVKQKLQLKLQAVIRHWFLYRIGVWKYRWDEGFTTETVRPEKIGIDPRATSLGNCEFMYELMEDKIGDLIEEYPKKKKEIIAKYGSDRMKSKIRYIEFWGGGGEWFVKKLGNIILDKGKNPNFDYGSDVKGKEGEEEYEPAKEGTYNLFKKPQFPYLILNVFNLGKNLYDDTSLVELSISLQDAINKRKNQISDLTDEKKKMIIASSKAISKEEFQKFINKYGMVGIWLDNGEIADIKVEGEQADASTFNDLSHSIGEIDNLMGTHSTTRGERGEQETATGRKLLQAGDYGRTETIVLRIEQLMEDWYNAYLHMLKVYSLEDAEFDDGEKTITLSRDEIPKGVVVMVKKGSTLPVDKASRAELAVKLAQFNFIDPLTLFEELGYGKEEERTQKLYDWLAKTGKIQPEQPTGQPGAAGGSPQGQQQQQLARLKQVMSSEKFKQLSPEQQKPIIQQARAIVEKIKGGK